jgi:DNA-binding transcriptional LysR family regulator
MHFDLIDLRLFLNVATTRSLTKGAERTHLSLPAASARMKNLEESIGAKLLYRHAQGVTLTPPGDTFLHHARQVVLQTDLLRGDMQEYARGVKGHVRIFANTTSITEFLPDALRRYLATHPDINVDLQEHLSPDIVRAVLNGTTDVGIVAGSVHTLGLEVFPYLRDRLVLATAVGHPLASLDAVDFEHTLDHDFIDLPAASAIHTFLERAADDLHKRVRVRVQVGSFEAVCRMIEANIGIGIVPESAARRHAQAMRLAIIPLRDGWSVRELKICVRSLEQLTPFSRELVEMLTADARIA